MQREDFLPQRLAVDEERLLPQDASDGKLLHLGEAAVLLQDIKYARYALWLLAVTTRAAVCHHLARVHIPNLVRAFPQSGGHGSGARAGWDGRDLEGWARGGAGRAVYVHAVVGCRVTVGQRHGLASGWTRT